MLYQSREYRDYLRSPEWARRRSAALDQARHCCQRCGAPATEVHHTTYERLRNERASDLEALCGACHIEADRQRRAKSESGSWSRRVRAWARKRYGDDWDAYDSFETMSDEFAAWLADQ